MLSAHLMGMDTDDAAPTPRPWDLEPLLDITELAGYLGVPVTTIYDWRTNGKGPPAYRFGKRIKFAVSDVRAWLAEHREPKPPAEPGPG